MKYKYTQDYESCANVQGKMIVFVPGEVYELPVVPNRLKAHLVPVVEEAPVNKEPIKLVKKTPKTKKLLWNINAPQKFQCLLF